MASLDLRKLWAVHLIDDAILEVRRRASALDVGQTENQTLKQLLAEEKTVGEAAKEVLRELKDLELKEQGIEEKLNKNTRLLFGGTITNPREVDALERDSAMLKRHRTEMDDRLLALMEKAPDAKATVDRLNSEIAKVKATITEKQAKAAKVKTELETEYKKEVARRAEAVKAVPAGLYAQYEAIRARQNGVGIAKISRQGACGACGTLLAERIIQLAQEDRIITCESCHRLIYYSEGVL